MNKDVIYIEPEDDITDIISKLRASRQKVVALVPPKKIGVLRSAVNTKLIAKAAKSADKVAVIVTTDSSLVKLAASAGIPVAKNLQSRPKLPSEITEEEVKAETVIEDQSTEPVENSDKKSDEKKSVEASPKEVKPEEKSGKKDKKGKKSKEDEKNLPFLKRNRKWIILGSVGVVGLIVFLVWAFAFAPASTIAVQIRTTSNNFSEAVTFTTSAANASTKDGKFLLETQTYKQENAVTFEATGKRDIGEKATGVLKVELYVKSLDTPVQIPSGTTFTIDNLTYSVTKGASVTWEEQEDDSDTISVCENTVKLTDILKQSFSGCLMTAVVEVQATESGDKYNISPRTSGWITSFSAAETAKIYNQAAFQGGTSEIITIVTEADIVSATAALAAKVTGDGKNKLMASIPSDVMVMEGTYSEDPGAAVSTPAVGEKVENGVTPKLTSTTTYQVLTLDTTNLKEYIEAKTNEKLAADQEIYETTDPFLERFTEDGGGGYTARLKATTKVGPKVTEEEILEKSRGRKVGEVQSLLKSINGVSSCKVETSFFWVNSVPDDPNKITISLEVEK